MSTSALTKVREVFPTVFNDFLKPFDDWFDNRGLLQKTMTVPAVNITEEDKCYKATMAAPGMKKDDFKIDLDGNLLSISAEKEEEKEEKEKKYTRQEYSYSSFTRCFTIPEEVAQDRIEATYENGLLELTLPKKDGGKASNGRKIVVN